MSNYTTKTQEALQAAVQRASALGNPDIRPAHVLAAILEQPDSIAIPVLQSAGGDVDAIRAGARAQIDSFPRAAGANMANPNFSRDMVAAFGIARDLA